MTKIEAVEICIARYVKNGGNEEYGRELLAEEIKGYKGVNLVSSLAYYNFATTIRAPILARALVAA